MTKYNCTATVELELRGRLCSITAYGLATHYRQSYNEPADYDMEIVAIENYKGRPISARVEALIDGAQWDYIVYSLWEYEGGMHPTYAS